MTVELNVAVEHTFPTTPVVSVSGDIDMQTAPTLLGQLLDLAKNRPHAIVVDLTGVDFLDSSGISTLIQAHKRLRDEDGRLLIATKAPMIRKVFEITGVDRVLQVFPTLSEALSATAFREGAANPDDLGANLGP